MRKIADLTAAKEAVRNNVDILEVIRKDLEQFGDKYQWKEGSGMWWTTSPFRDETKPSFSVNRQRRTFKDFGGDGLSGDVFAWLKVWHNISFEESIFRAAQYGGFDITPFLRDPTPEEIQRDRYIQANSVAATIMHQNMRESLAVRDRYLNETGFTIDMLEPYQVGYCPSTQWLITELSRRVPQLTEDDVHKLEFNRNDLFNDCIIYPIHNASGQVIAFRTAAASDRPDRPKYIGMKHEHPLHDPGTLYGFHVIRKHLRDMEWKVIVVEGHKDSIATKGIAVMGSSLSKEQIKTLLDNGVVGITVMYDGDNTGETKTLALIDSPDDFQYLSVMVARPTVMKDPHDIWKEGGSAAIEHLIGEAKIPIQYFVEKRYDTKSRKLSFVERVTLMQELKKHLCRLTRINLELTASYIGEVCDVSREAVMAEVDELKAKEGELYSVVLEHDVVYYCLTNPQALIAYKAKGLSPDAFAIYAYKRIFDSALFVYGANQSNYTVQMIADNVMTRFRDSTLLSKITEVLSREPQYPVDVAGNLVNDLHQRRKTLENATKLSALVRDLNRPLLETITGHRKDMISTFTLTDVQPSTPHEIAMDGFDAIKARCEAGQGSMPGFDFSEVLPQTCALVGGLQPRHYMVISGATNAGKSTLALNIFRHLTINKKIPGLWIAQEMFTTDNTLRTVSQISGISSTAIRFGALEAKENHHARIGAALTSIDTSQYYSRKPTEGTIDEILAIIDEFRFKYDIKFIVWDYIQMVRPSPNQLRSSREEVIGHASKCIKNRVNNDMGLAAIIVSQRNRDSDASGTGAVMGSYQISQDSDEFIEISEKSKKEQERDGSTMGNRFISIAKNRHGPAGGKYSAMMDNSTLTMREHLTAEQKTQFAKVLVG